MKKLIKESLFEESVIHDTAPEEIPIYRIRMVKDIEFTPDEIEKYKEANSMYDEDLKKICTGLAKTKWRNMVKAALETKTPESIKNIDDRGFKFYL